MAEFVNIIWESAEKFHGFLTSPGGIRLLNIAFISSSFFLVLLSLSFLFRQEFMLILSLALSLGFGSALYFLSIHSTPLPDQYGIVDRFLILTGAKHVSDPHLHITAGAGVDRESALLDALDTAFSVALGTDQNGIFKNIHDRDFPYFEKKYRSFFKVTKEKKLEDKDILEIQWTLPAVRTFLLRYGFSPVPVFLNLEILKNTLTTPSQTLIDQILVLYKAKSMYFKNGVFYATCEAIIKELSSTKFKTSAGELEMQGLSFEEKESVSNNKICSIKVGTINVARGGN